MKKVLISLIEEGLRREGSFSFRIRGNSMKPVLRQGDRIEVGPFQKGAAVPGQIVVYRREEEEVVVHRLMKLETQNGEAICVISPDVAPLCPEMVPADRILGAVKRIFRKEQELPLNRGWRLWWGRFLQTVYRLFSR